MPAELPEPLPDRHCTDSAELCRWTSDATVHEIIGSYRPGRSPDSALVVRLADGRELFFPTVAEASRPEVFLAAFLSIDGVPMPEYTKGQVRIIVGAILRMAAVGRERDDRAHWSAFGETYLRALLLSPSPTRAIARRHPETEAERWELYSEAAKYAQTLGRLGEGELPKALHILKPDCIYIPRGPFQDWALTRNRGTSPQTLMAQMRRVEWVDDDIRPRRPGASPEAPRPHLRMWAIPNGWDGLLVADGILHIAGATGVGDTRDQPGPDSNGSGPAVPPGPAQRTGVRASARSSTTQPGPRDQDRIGDEARQ